MPGRLAFLYGIGTDSPVVAHALIAEEYASGQPADEGYVGVRRSALQMSLEGESLSSSPNEKHGKSKYEKGSISRGETHFQTEGSASLSSLERYGDVSPVQRKMPISKNKANVGIREVRNQKRSLSLFIYRRGWREQVARRRREGKG